MRRLERLRRAKVERCDDPAAHRDAMNASREPREKRGREESAHPIRL
jgi:hypothetical protein